MEYTRITISNAKVIKTVAGIDAPDAEPTVTLEIFGITNNVLKRETYEDIHKKLGDVAFIVDEAIENASIINLLRGRITRK